jgi:hypothetical protein
MNQILATPATIAATITQTVLDILNGPRALL